MKDNSPMFVLLGLVAVVGYLHFTGSFRQNKWAFAENKDGTILEREECRETLADVIYDNDLKSAGSDNVYLMEGYNEAYFIHGFKTRSECDTALTNMVLRRKR